MATHSTTYSLSADLAQIIDCDKELQGIINEVNHYLYNFAHNWFYLAIGRSHFHKCTRSWIRVYTHLEKFLQDPRSNYSMLMFVLEHEIQKFPKGSFLYNKFIRLEQLVAMGPHFSDLHKS